MQTAKLSVRRFYEFIRFCIVGIGNTTINYTIYLVLLFYHIHYLIAGAIGYLSSAVFGFLLNRIWTFKSKVPYFYLLIYLIINLFSMSVSVLVQWVVVEKLHVKIEFSLLFAIAVTTFINYFLTRKLVFAKQIN